MRAPAGCRGSQSCRCAAHRQLAAPDACGSAALTRAAPSDKRRSGAAMRRAHPDRGRRRRPAGEPRARARGRGLRGRRGPGRGGGPRRSSRPSPSTSCSATCACPGIDGLELLPAARAAAARRARAPDVRLRLRATSPSRRCAAAPTTTWRSPSSPPRCCSTLRKAQEREKLRRANQLLPARRRARGRRAADRRGLRGDDRGARARRARRGVQGHRAAAGRERHRQGAARARDPRAVAAPRRGLRRRQLRGDPRGAARERALRPREGRLHRRRPRAPRPLQRGRRRHALPRRDRRAPARPPGEAPARAPGGGGPRRRRGEAPQRRRARDRRDRPRPRGGGRRRAASARTSSTASTSCACRSRRCASGARTSRSSSTTSSAAAPRDARQGGRAASTTTRSSASWRYDWPGNVRELENVIERAVILARGDRLGLADLPAEPRGRGARERRSASRDLSLRRARRALEARLITEALDATSGNRTHAARLLGISHRALLYKLKEYGLRQPRGLSGPRSRSGPGARGRPGRRRSPRAPRRAYSELAPVGLAGRVVEVEAGVLRLDLVLLVDEDALPPLVPESETLRVGRHAVAEARWSSTGFPRAVLEQALAAVDLEDVERGLARRRCTGRVLAERLEARGEHVVEEDVRVRHELLAVGALEVEAVVARRRPSSSRRP